MLLVTSEQMQALDQHTIETLNIPGIVLMDHAGRAVAEAVRARQPQRVLVLCGKGNNGGDGWAAARWLQHWGCQVQVLTVIDPLQLRGEAALAAASACSSGVPWQLYHPGTPLPEADVYVDALLGTGAARPLTGVWATLVEQLNQQSRWTLAVDVPSGIDPSTGAVPGPAVRAHATLCLGLQKLGTAVTPGCLYAGDVRVADIGIALPDPQTAEGPAWVQWISRWTVRQAVRPRTPDTHKGSYGRVAVVAGEMAGAAVLAAWGAARAGAGLVVLGGAAPVAGAPFEFVQRPGAAGDLAWCNDCQALVLGPGLGSQAAAWRRLLDAFAGPGVLDADGLRLLTTTDTHLPRWVLTPHPKECARLLGITVQQVQAARLQAARSLAQRTGAVVVLKGYRTLVADPLGRVRVNPTGDASLATAGTGDVLAGVIGGLLAQGADPWTAALAGVWLHGRAGELAGARVGPAGVMASDVAAALTAAVAECLTPAATGSQGERQVLDRAESRLNDGSGPVA
ncbi:MAG: NAD(P)H-hydrate dehydratase [Alicyclobacillus sp.]|nr:NAD(P)H-hydrate dehydratase [Alicyclobacillus sp.]